MPFPHSPLVLLTIIDHQRLHSARIDSKLLLARKLGSVLNRCKCLVIET